jgi:hypothetical protein
MTRQLGISGVHTHSLRHQFASEALDVSPRELANISQVLGHDSVQTTLRFYIHPSANAEQRIGVMMNTRRTTPPGPRPCHGHSGSAPSAFISAADKTHDDQEHVQRAEED